MSGINSKYAGILGNCMGPFSAVSRGGKEGAGTGSPLTYEAQASEGIPAHLAGQRKECIYVCEFPGPTDPTSRPKEPINSLADMAYEASETPTILPHPMPKMGQNLWGGSGGCLKTGTDKSGKVRNVPKSSKTEANLPSKTTQRNQNQLVVCCMSPCNTNPDGNAGPLPANNGRGSASNSKSDPNKGFSNGRGHPGQMQDPVSGKITLFGGKIGTDPGLTRQEGQELESLKVYSAMGDEGQRGKLAADFSEAKWQLFGGAKQFEKKSSNILEMEAYASIKNYIEQNVSEDKRNNVKILNAGGNSPGIRFAMDNMLRDNSPDARGFTMVADTMAGGSPMPTCENGCDSIPVSTMGALSDAFTALPDAAHGGVVSKKISGLSAKTKAETLPDYTTQGTAGQMRLLDIEKMADDQTSNDSGGYFLMYADNAQQAGGYGDPGNKTIYINPEGVESTEVPSFEIEMISDPSAECFTQTMSPNKDVVSALYTNANQDGQNVMQMNVETTYYDGTVESEVVTVPLDGLDGGRAYGASNLPEIDLALKVGLA
jgi:hypothetical protein